MTFYSKPAKSQQVTVVTYFWPHNIIITQPHNYINHLKCCFFGFNINCDLYEQFFTIIVFSKLSNTLKVGSKEENEMLLQSGQFDRNVIFFSHSEHNFSVYTNTLLSD